MSKRQILILLGVWVAIFLFLGFPISWKEPIAILTGLIIIFVAYRLQVVPVNRDQESKPFVEHKSGNTINPVIPENK